MTNEYYEVVSILETHNQSFNIIAETLDSVKESMKIMLTRIKDLEAEVELLKGKQDEVA